MKEIFLSASMLQSFDSCAMRQFEENECHITRYFAYSVLILMFSGKLRFTEDGKDIELEANEYYIQRHGLFQEGRVPSDAPRYFYIHFNGNFTEKPDGIPIRGHISPNEILPYIKKLESMAAQRENIFAQNGIFYSILGCLNPLSGIRSNTAKDIAEFISAHYSEHDFSINSIMTEFSYNKDYIIRLFKKYFLTTPHKYITKMRIDYGAQMLISTSKSVAEIAYDCGYDDYSVFYKNFIKEKGVSPTEWINRHIKF